MIPGLRVVDLVQRHVSERRAIMSGHTLNGAGIDTHFERVSISGIVSAPSRPLARVRQPNPSCSGRIIMQV